MRRITVRLADYVEEEKRRNRRGGRVLAAAAIVAAAVIAMSRPTTTTTAGTDTSGTTTTTTTTTATTTTTTIPPPPAQLSPTPPALPFAAQLVGTASDAQLLRLRNTGDQPLTISSIAASDDAFRVKHDCAPELAKNDSCSVAVVFAPPSAGRHEAELKIATNVETRRVALSGAGNAVPTVDLGPLNFGRAMIRTARPPQRVRFANSGPLTVSFGVPSITAPFVVTANGCAEVPPGGNCDVEVALPADVAGGFKGELRLVDRQANAVAAAALSGVTFEAPILTNTPPKVEVLKKERDVIVRNLSGRPVQIDIGVEGTTAMLVIDTKPCSKVYQNNETCVMTWKAGQVFTTHAVKLSVKLVARYEGQSQSVQLP